MPEDTICMLRQISDLLAEEYGSPRHGNPCDPLDDLIYLMLSRKTPISKAREIYTDLHDEIDGNWETLLERGVEYIYNHIYSLGMARQRAQNLYSTVEMVKQHFSRADLTALGNWPESEVESFLTSLPGVGTKTARCVMMYTLEPGKFPADAHCIRILSRISILKENTASDHRKSQQYLADLIPQDIVYDLHVNLVAHGQDVCYTPIPRCKGCVINGLCAFRGHQE